MRDLLAKLAQCEEQLVGTKGVLSDDAEEKIKLLE